MSWTRNRFDLCSYNKDLSQSTSSLNYTLDVNKHYSCSDCMNEFGLIAGNNVSITKNNMVDVESDLFNITRQASRCPERKFLPICDCDDSTSGMPCGSQACKDAEKGDYRHLPRCQMIQYSKRIDHVGYDLKFPGCPTTKTTSANGQVMINPPQINPIQWKGQTQEYRESDIDNVKRLRQLDSRTVTNMRLGYSEGAEY